MRAALRAALLYCAVTVVLLWPLLSRLGSAFVHDAGDSVLNTWILWWGTKALPLSRAWWNGPIFFPATDTVALSELLLAQLPVSSAVQWLTGNPVAAFNAVYGLSFAASGLSSYLLARELTGRDDAALVGGLAFMLAPYRATQLSHLQVLSFYWAPIVLLGLHRHVTRGGWRWLALSGTAWLLQSLANGYALFQVPILAALWLAWFVRPARRALTTGLALGVAVLPMLPILLEYLAVHTRLHLLRDINEIRRFGVDLADLVAAPPDLWLWGGRLGVARPETAAFPGLTVLAVGLAALMAGRLQPSRDAGAEVEAEPGLGEHHGRDAGRRRWPRWLAVISACAALVALSVHVVGPWTAGPLTVGGSRKPLSIAVALALSAFLGSTWTRRLWRRRSLAGFYVLATAAMYLLALGPEPRFAGTPILYEPPYAWLMRLPGFDAMRVPARFLMLAALCQAMLLALAVARWATGARRWPLIALIASGIVADGWVRTTTAEAPQGGIRQWPPVAAVVELPLGDMPADFGAMYRSMAHGLPIVNGVSGYYPPHVLPLAGALRAGEFEALRELAPHAPIGVAVDRSRADARAAEAALAALGRSAMPPTDGWVGFIVPPHPAAARPLGPRLGPVMVEATPHPEHVLRMLDDDLLTAWGTETPQVGGETLTIDLGRAVPVGAVVLAMGAYSFGYPRRLEIALSRDGIDWTLLPRELAGVLTVRAAVREPRTVPVSFALGNGPARFIRVRQSMADPTTPWWIAELEVRGPAAP